MVCVEHCYFMLVQSLNQSGDVSTAICAKLSGESFSRKIRRLRTLFCPALIVDRAMEKNPVVIREPIIGFQKRV